MAEPEGVQQLGWWRVTLPYLYSSPFGTLSTFLCEADTNEWNITLNTTLAIHFPHRNHGARHDIRLTCLCVIKSFLSIFYLQSFGLLKKSTTTSFSNINSNALNIRKYPPAKPLHWNDYLFTGPLYFTALLGNKVVNCNVIVMGMLILSIYQLFYCYR